MRGNIPGCGRFQTLDIHPFLGAEEIFVVREGIVPGLGPPASRVEIMSFGCLQETDYLILSFLRSLGKSDEIARDGACGDDSIMLGGDIEYEFHSSMRSALARRLR